MPDTPGKLERGYITPRGNYPVNIRTDPRASAALIGRLSGLYMVDRQNVPINDGSYTFYYVEFVAGVPGPNDDNVSPGWVAFDFISWLPAQVYDPGTVGEGGVTHFLTILKAFLTMTDLLLQMLSQFRNTLVETMGELENPTPVESFRVKNWTKAIQTAVSALLKRG